MKVQSTPDGKVTLRGEVESQTERELVGRVASSVRGVTAVNNEIEVQYRRNRPDSEIAADIRGLFRWDAYIEDSGINVSVADGVASLSGEVASAAEKRRTHTLAWVSGIKEVRADALDVTGTTRSANQLARSTRDTSDEAITKAVERALAANAGLNRHELRIKVRDGIATLRGEAQSLRAKRTAERVAMSVEGVDTVRNRIRTNGLPSVSDDQLRQRVSDTLAANIVTQFYDVTVDVDRGNVT